MTQFIILLILVIIIPLSMDFVPDILSKVVFRNIIPLFYKDKHERKIKKRIAKILCDNKLSSKEQNDIILKMFDEEQHLKKLRERKEKIKILTNLDENV